MNFHIETQKLTADILLAPACFIAIFQHHWTIELQSKHVEFAQIIICAVIQEEAG